MVFHFPTSESRSGVFPLFSSRQSEGMFALKMVKRMEKKLVWSLVNKVIYFLLNQARF